MLCGELSINDRMKLSCLPISKYNFLFIAYYQSIFIFVYFLMHVISMVVYMSFIDK